MTASSSATIRPVDFSDMDALARIYAHAVTDSATSFETSPPDAAAFAIRVGAHNETHPWLVCSIDDAVVGYAYACPHRVRDAYQWSVEVSV